MKQRTADFMHSDRILSTCVNGDFRPICPPSKVLCAECLEKLNNKFEELGKSLEEKR